MRVIIIFWLFLVTFQTAAQKSINLIFHPVFETEKLTLEKIYFFKGDTLKISSFKCYITDLKYYNKNSLVHTSLKKAHLIDASDSSTFDISENKFFKFDELRFNIGVDSLTNISGVYEGDLDPAKGMYWTWQSGYINFKLEGISSLCPARKNKFYWHIGGYLTPFKSLRTVRLKFSKNSSNQVSIQIDRLFEEVNVSKVYQVMSPNEKAILIANKLPKLFKIAP